LDHQLILWIADAFGTIGMFMFLKAEVHQWFKIRRTKKVSAISTHAYRDKMIAIITTLVCFGLTSLWFSFLVIFCEGIVALFIIKLMRKYKKEKVKTSLEELWDNPEDDIWNDYFLGDDKK